MATGIAFILMATKFSCPAYLNGRHGPLLIAGHSMGSSVVRAVLTEDIRHLDTAR